MDSRLRKKIGVVCNYRLMPERVGGMDRFFWTFDASCNEAGYNVIWFFPNSANHEGYEKLNIVSADKHSLESAFLDYINHNASFDTLITHFVELCSPFFKKVKMACKIRTVVVDHNPRPLGGYSLKTMVVKRVKSLLYSQYIDLFVGVSQYTEAHIIKDFGSYLNSKTIVVYNGIECALFLKRRIRNNFKPTFIVASHLRESKGIQDLIQAVSILPDEIKSELKIDIYGEGPFKDSLAMLIHSLDLDSVFVFKGSVPNLYSIYSQYDYLLQPTHMECFSMSILESLSANVPVITTSVGGNEEVITNNENGFIYEPQDILALAAILENIFLGKHIISGNINNAIESRFSIEKMVQQYIKII